jgi:hypothetical protein
MRSEVVFASVLALACGQVLVGGGYRGEVLLTFSGAVVNELPPELLDFDLDAMRITVIWLTPGAPQDAAPTDVEGIEILTAFPAKYELHLYQPPPPEALFDGPWDSDTRVAVAVPVLFVDSDGNGRWDREDERIVGGSFDVVGVWAESDGTFVGLDTATSDTAVILWETELTAGYQKMLGTVNWCDATVRDPDAPAVLLPAGDTAANLYVGPIWDYLTQWRCEW